MAGSVDGNNKELQFCWGMKGGYGGSKKEYQFYKSFTMDNVTYSLYDCVYLYKAGEPKPYIGKIIKIWEWEKPKSKKKERKAKILWFFRPSEIKNYLRDYALSEKEIFLASGEGCGLCNINPLEAIAGKCSVICTAKDERNPQPSKEDLEMADYIFSCTFHVQNYIISQKIDDQIAGIEAKFLFNRVEDLKPRSTSNLDDNGISQNGEAGLRSTAHPGAKDALEDLGTELKDSAKSVPTSTFSNGKKVQPSNHVENSLEPCKMEANRDADVERPSKKVKLAEDSIKFSKDTQNDTTANKIDKSEKDNSLEDHLYHKKAINQEEAEEEPCKKKSLAGDSVGQIKNNMESKKPMTGLEKNESFKDLQPHKESSDKLKLKEKKVQHPEEPQQKLASENDEIPSLKTIEVTKKPDSDRSKWFKALPWITKLRKADELGTLVLIENLDPSYTSSEIEGIINDIFNQSCTVKVAPQGSFQNPNYGQAYAIFRTREAANMVVSRINQGCLLQPNGSPLICSKGLLKVPEHDLRGHLSIDKVKSQREEMKNAVSTSHCSQPNTIEYEMAAEWIVLQEKFRRHANCLYKEQVKEQNSAKKNLKFK